MQLVILLPIHIVCVVSTVLALQNLLPESVYDKAFGPIEYAKHSPWFLVSPILLAPLSTFSYAEPSHVFFCRLFVEKCLSMPLSV